MQLQTIDLAVLAIYVAFAIGVGLYFRQRASKDPDQFFLAGRKLPWWMVGTSMVATTFSRGKFSLIVLVLSGRVSRDIPPSPTGKSTRSAITSASF